ncbi:MAG: type II toxin-antitoxin system RelE/ParE family toxin [Candidatus Cyclobacteriaceae bacterium M2_1C_046]
MVEIRWLTEAKEDLRDIYDYISRDSKRYAKRQIDKIFNRSLILKDHIQAGRIVEETNNPEIREIIEGNYRIIYRIVTESTVEILMIHHGARELTRRISKK